MLSADMAMVPQNQGELLPLDQQRQLSHCIRECELVKKKKQKRPENLLFCSHL